MPVDHQTVLYDVHDCAVWPMTADGGASPTYGSGVDVFGIAQVAVNPNLFTAELKGDAKVIARKGRVDKWPLTLTYGKLDLDVLDVVLEGTLTDTGTTPNQIARFRQGGDNSLPYFRIAVQIEDVDIDVGAVRITLYKAQLTGGTILGQQSDQFGQPTMEVEGIPAESDDSYFCDIDIYETATPML